MAFHDMRKLFRGSNSCSESSASYDNPRTGCDQLKAQSGHRSDSSRRCGIIMHTQGMMKREPEYDEVTLSLIDDLSDHIREMCRMAGNG